MAESAHPWSRCPDAQNVPPPGLGARELRRAGDLHVVALDDASVTLSSATASLSAIWLDDCAGGAGS
ncbi:MAG: hypothetical protein IPI35_27010 [Deltaproteobacteria bacterium]|nr:hypothetical protein [Deltaproteobacteria bacterium]